MCDLNIDFLLTLLPVEQSIRNSLIKFWPIDKLSWQTYSLT